MPTKTLTKDLAKKAGLLRLAGDETRICILCALMERDNSCVSDITKCLKSNIAAVSHHLQLMQKHGLLKSTRKGKQICYSINKNELTDSIRNFICK